MCLEMASEFEFGHRRAVLWRLGELRAESRMRHHHHILLMFESLRDENRLHPGNRTERKEAGLTWRNMAQPKADWGQTWTSLALTWAEQEPTWAEQRPVPGERGPP
jgi:hypothetical protein